jgi:hypothetical protein
VEEHYHPGGNSRFAKATMPPKKRSKPVTLEELVDTEPARREAIWRDIKKPLAWLGAAFLTLVAVVFVSTTDRGAERIAALPGAVGQLMGQAPPAPATEVARVEQELAGLRDEARRTTLQRLALEQRLAELERGFGDVTGTVRRSDRDLAGLPPVTDRTPPVAAETPPREPAPVREDTAAAPAAPAQPEGVPPGNVTLASRTQFGVDLGAEISIAALRLRWQRLSQRPPLSELEPVLVVREGQGGRPLLHVIAGPIADISEAATLCARLRAGGVSTCQPASYDGQRLNPR